MKKKILLILWFFIISIGATLAYTPSSELEDKLDTVTEKINSIISNKWNAYRAEFLTVLEEYALKYADDERASYILAHITENLIGIQLNDVSPILPIIVSSDGDYTGSYTISDDTYGTEVKVIVQWNTRTITSNALPNHEVGEFPRAGNPNTISAQDKNWELTTNPTYTGNETWMRESGVAYNGVKFELETAEGVSCSSGETYRIEAQQTAFNLGLDMNLAHVQPTGEYHYHGVSDLLIDTLEWDNLVHVWYANDWFPIYYSKEQSYTPSYSLKTESREGTSCTYAARETVDVVIDGTTPDGTYDLDWEYTEGLGNLDACNGATVNGEYMYFLTENFPFGPRCSNGEVTAQGNPQGQWGGWQGGAGRPEGGPRGQWGPR